MYLTRKLPNLLLAYPAINNSPLRVPWSYVRRMQKSDPHGPLLLQVFPHAHENNNITDFNKDPVGDLSSIKITGLL